MRGYYRNFPEDEKIKNNIYVKNRTKNMSDANKEKRKEYVKSNYYKIKKLVELFN